MGETLEAVIKTVIAGDIKHTFDPPPTPKPLEAICLRAIARRPDDRYATAAEIGQEIERWLDDLPVKHIPNHYCLNQNAGFVPTKRLSGQRLRSSSCRQLVSACIGYRQQEQRTAGPEER